MGTLDHYSPHHSYGICEECAHRYFAYLYEPEVVLEPASVSIERRVGVD
jgi:hypothetical protein